MRYGPLKEHLSSSPAGSVELTYEQIEGILGRRLPDSAYGDSWRQWWANTPSHSQAKAWLDAGWRVARPDLARRVVRFERESGAAVPGPVEGAVASESGRAEGRDAIVLPGGHLIPSALRLVEDAAEEVEGDLGRAVAELLNRAAMARRRQVLDWFAQNASSGGAGTSGADLIREDRDGRR